MLSWTTTVRITKWLTTMSMATLMPLSCKLGLGEIDSTVLLAGPSILGLAEAGQTVGVISDPDYGCGVRCVSDCDPFDWRHGFEPFTARNGRGFPPGARGGGKNGAVSNSKARPLSCNHRGQGWFQPVRGNTKQVLLTAEPIRFVHMMPHGKVSGRDESIIHSINGRL